MHHTNTFKTEQFGIESGNWNRRINEADINLSATYPISNLARTSDKDINFYVTMITLVSGNQRWQKVYSHGTVGCNTNRAS